MAHDIQHMHGASYKGAMDLRSKFNPEGHLLLLCQTRRAPRAPTSSSHCLGAFATKVVTKL